MFFYVLLLLIYFIVLFYSKQSIFANNIQIICIDFDNYIEKILVLFSQAQLEIELKERRMILLRITFDHKLIILELFELEKN